MENGYPKSKAKRTAINPSSKSLYLISHTNHQINEHSLNDHFLQIPLIDFSLLMSLDEAYKREKIMPSFCSPFISSSSLVIAVQYKFWLFSLLWKWSMCHFSSMLCREPAVSVFVVCGELIARVWKPRVPFKPNAGTRSALKPDIHVRLEWRFNDLIGAIWRCVSILQMLRGTVH